ncbi:thiolase C-terminal domain-containing protein [Amycolatopsis granulosa]|uniref:thiolase C-terminal domain-containing protein n=1 Tax=Amycolatopsis granulosa TaxID=185684 RepID=UPI00141EB243|nr:thiolase [Amycolatopsis granulosa]NIH87099.1 acetyl-CoA acetyltransferase [Amycolatopsis granulosa]
MPEFCIAGVAESPLGHVTDQSEPSMIALAAMAALDEAGIARTEVDGLFVNYLGEEGSVQLGEYLGIEPSHADSSDLGGGSWVGFIGHAMAAIAAGQCEVALLAYASRQRTLRKRSRAHVLAPPPPESITAQFDQPAGVPVPIGHFALVTARHMYEYGTTEEQLASVAVTGREWARLNPKAWRRDPLTVEDVLASDRICGPIKKLDCCPITDGGGAIVVTTAERARAAKRPPVGIRGWGESHTHWHPHQRRDITSTAAVRSGRLAYEMAGIGPEDVDIFQPYDAFTITPILQLEDLGFCEKGAGGEMFAQGHLRPGGKLPAMTSGGGLSYTHPGAFGIFLVIEAVRQLRGEAGDRQVNPAPRTALVNGIGGLCSYSSTVVLTND